jgi:predicted nucleotidyltransferase
MKRCKISRMAQVDVAQYRAFWRKLAQAELTPEMRVAVEQARAEAKRLAQILADDYGVERVYLFGSFAWGNKIRPESDIDLAVEGLPPRQLFKAYGRLEKATHYAFDLVPLENTLPRFREQILTSGVLAYDSASKPSTG